MPNQAPIYLLSSDEPLLKLDRADELMQLARKQLPDADFLIFTDADFSGSTKANLVKLENELRDPGLFGGDRILKLYFKEYNNIAAQVLQCIAQFYRPGVFIIIDLPRLNASFNKLPPKPVPETTPKRVDLKNAAISYLKHLGASLEIFYAPDGARLQQFVVQRCAKYGFRLSPECSALLASLNEGNLTAIDGALKLMTLSDKKGDITLDDLNTYFVQDSRFSAFELTEALLSGQGPRALNILHSVFSAQSGGAAAQMPLIISRLDTCLNVIVKMREQRLGSDAQGQALMRQNAIVTPALQRAVLMAVRNMPPHLLQFLIRALKDCALLHSHFRMAEAQSLLQTMAVSVNHFEAMAYAQS